MFMTPLNYEDLNLESENDSELLRDALIEKVSKFDLKCLS